MKFSASLHLADNYPGIQGVGFSLMIPAAEKTNHLAKIRREGFPEYFIRPEGERDIYTSIIYLEPFADRNLRAFGYDMYSEPVRHDAMQKALESGNTSLSGKVRLVQESGKNEQAGFLMYLPVYRNDRPHATVSARTENIIGWVYSPFRMDDFMAGAQGERAADLDIEIFDGESTSFETLLHDSDGSLTAQLPVASSYFTEQRLQVVDHTWTIRIHPLAPMETQIDSTKSLYFAGFGSLISVLVSALIGLLLSGRDRAIRTAQMMSQELIHERTNLNRIIEGTQAGTWEWNVQTGECVFNAQWAAIIGYELIELEPISIETWRKFAHPDDIKVSEDLLAKHFAGQLQYYQCESRMRHKDGHWIWIMDRGAVATRTPEGKPLMMFGTHQDITERKKAEALFRGLFDQSSFLAGILDQRGCLVDVNTTALGFTDLPKDELIGQYFPDTPWWSQSDDRYKLMEAMNFAYKGKVTSFETIHLVPTGNYIYVMFCATPIIMDSGIYVSVIGVDITERILAEKALQESEERFRHFFESNSSVMVLINPETNTVAAVNQAAVDYYGYNKEQFIGKHMSDINMITTEQIHETQPSVLPDERNAYNFSHRLKSGEIRNVEVHTTRINTKNKPMLFSIIYDVTERNLLQEQIQQLAFYDPLTNLPNRRLLNDRITQSMANSKRNHSYGALMFMDLDNFKPLNDKHGHDLGDLLLIEVSYRLKGCVREMDTVARLGGDEFVVLLNELAIDKTKATSEAQLVAEKILASLSAPYLLAVVQNGQSASMVEHRCTASIGVAMFIYREDIQDDFIKRADAAMYQAKEHGRNTIQFYFADA